MTAHALKGDRELCISAGMDSYVTKPIRREELFSTIETVLAAQAERLSPGLAASPVSVTRET